MSGLLDFKSVPITPGKLYDGDVKKQTEFKLFIKQFERKILESMTLPKDILSYKDKTTEK